MLFPVQTFEVPPTSGHLQSLRLQSVTTNPGESQQADVSVKFGNNTAQLKVGRLESRGKIVCSKNNLW